MRTATLLTTEERLEEPNVQISPIVLDAIRDAVLDGYAAAPHGGVEIGFVLLGRRNQITLSIDDFREIPCAHLLGPRFLLSADEEERFPDWQANLLSDLQTKGLSIVGWGCSHNRSGLALLDREVSFHQRFFPHPENVAVVVTPQGLQSVLAGVFQRNADGKLNPQCPTIQLRSATLYSFTGGETATVQESVRAAGVEPSATCFGVRKPRWSSGKRLVLSVALASMLAFTAIPGGFLLYGRWVSPSRLSLELRPQSGNLTLTWTGDIDHVRSAKVEILDGSNVSRYDVTNSFERSGVLVFPYKTANVQAILTVQTGTEELVRRAGYVDEQAVRASLSNYETNPADTVKLETANRRLKALVAVLRHREGNKNK